MKDEGVGGIEVVVVVWWFGGEGERGREAGFTSVRVVAHNQVRSLGQGLTDAAGKPKKGEPVV